ncbi:hypothetical protein N802_10200 [Knoellia sinensis KCTC 19936]|uniref:ATPase AAA n=1 Tax=Knoellia sinensis KCTC 19936 TaxID=1385520 RepID=A0A0A0J2P3_9MICO|nr:AAA domain-containing protein [Knoellia sinensis]KGN29911.1 hypothetical protein N802_10200 [Knoellia sinensis KCTC 19936]
MSSSDPLVDRAARLFRFLARAQQLKSKPVRNLDSYKGEGAVHWVGDVPAHRAVHVAHRDGDPASDGHLLSVERVERHEPPPPPDVLRKWLKGDPESASSQPDLWSTVPGGQEWDDSTNTFVDRDEKLADHPEVTSAYNAWMNEWRPWADRENQDAPVRTYYGELFSTFVKATSHTEELELVLGAGLLAWRPEDHPAVRRHAFTVPVIATMDDSSGRLDFVVDGAAVGLASELDMLDPKVIERRNIVQEAKQSAEQFGAHPFDREAFEHLARTLVNSLDSAGRYEDNTGVPAPADDAVLAWTPALILRPRSQRGLIQVFETIATDIEAAGEVPTGIRPLIDPGLVPAATTDRSPGALLDIDGEVFSPLPLNAVQRQILEQVDRNAQTLVQGPPGTGKTHTAAALLSHLLAQGKRVLVTAHTDRALQEVRGKLPERIKPLAVSVIGSSRSDLAELKLAVDTISRRSTEHDPAVANGEIEELLAGVAQLRGRRQELGARLLSARSADVQHREHAGYSGTLASIAQDYERERAALGWIGEFVDFEPHVVPPLSDVETVTWLDLVRDQSLAADSRQSAMRLLDIESLPSAEEFRSLVGARAEAEATRAQHADLLSHDAAAAIQSMATDERRALQERMRSIVQQFESLEQMRAEWVRSALSDVRHGLPQTWLARAETIGTLLSGVRSHLQKVPVGTTVSHSGDSGPLVALAKHVHNYLGANPPLKTAPDGSVKIGMFTPSAIKQARSLFDNVRVNGQPPATAEALALFLDQVDAERLLEQLDKAWPADLVIPAEDTARERLSWHQSQLDQLERVLALGRVLFQEESTLAASGLSRPDWNDPDAVITYAHLVDAAAAADAWRQAGEPLAALVETIRATSSWSDAAPAVHQLALAAENGDHEEYASAHARITRLHHVRGQLDLHKALTERIATAAPRLAEAVTGDFDNHEWTARLATFDAAWNWGTTGAWILAQDSTDVNDIQGQVSTVEAQLRDRAEHIGALRAWNQAVDPDRLTQRSRADLTQYSQLVRRLGKGTGKYAAQQRAEIRTAMDRCRPSVPVWIMPIYRIAEQLNVAENMFDVVLVDEASQAGLEAVFLQYLAPKIVVIGDDKQVSPTAVGVDQGELRELVEQYLDDDPYKASWLDPQRSLFDEAKMRFRGSLTLVEHRRCVPEIIGFSNRVAYEPDGIRLNPVRQFGADRLEPIKIVHLASGHEEGSSGNKVNRAEADALVDQLKACLEDPRYDGLTFGVIALLGKRQAQLIESKLLTEVSALEWADRDLRVGDAADFQGSERDVMFLSMVSSAEPGSRMASLTREMYMQRYNVAVSRAKDQLWLFHSATLDDLPNSEDMRHQLLEYCYGVAARGRELAAGESASVPDDVRVEPFDSLFEQRVYNKVVDRGFTVHPQFDANGYRIDLVVIGAGARLAIECDGDTWHGPEAYERDLARQRDLERCGWQFFRVRESAYYVDPARELARLWRLLDELEIRPSGWLTETLSDDDEAEMSTPEVGHHDSDELVDELRAESAPEFDSLEEELAAHVLESSKAGVAEGKDEEPAPLAEASLASQGFLAAEGTTSTPSERVPPAADDADADDFDDAPAVVRYRSFQGSVVSLAAATMADLAAGMIEIVRIEGPVTGSRLHTAYVRASGGRRVGKQIAHELNRAISSAVKAGHLVEENPLHQAGVKPKTYRLPWQPQVIARDLGARDLDEVPPSELAELLRVADQHHGWTSEGELFRHALHLLGRKALTEPARSRFEQVMPLAFPVDGAGRGAATESGSSVAQVEVVPDAPVPNEPAIASASITGWRRMSRDEDDWHRLVSVGRDILREVGGNRSTITYSELNGRLAEESGLRTFDLSTDLGRQGMGFLLGDISRVDHVDSGILLSSLVTLKGLGDVGRGFFSLAQELRLIPTHAGPLEKEAFWITEVSRAHEKCSEMASGSTFDSGVRS